MVEKDNNSESLDLVKSMRRFTGKKSYESLVQTFKNVNKNVKYMVNLIKFMMKFDMSSQPWMNEMRATRSRTLKDIDFIKINLIDYLESDDENKVNWSDDDY